ncbi:hypothetical protein ACLOJK_033410 [Asimina triloba]
MTTMKSAGRKNSSRPFKEFYSEWFDSLKNALLPFLRRAISSVSTSHIHVPVQRHPLGAVLASTSDFSSGCLSGPLLMLHNHFHAYFQALDLAARHDASQLLFPHWRNSLEKPFLWFGDLHPCLFTYLLRSFLANEEDDDDGNASKPNSHSVGDNNLPLPFSIAWKNPQRSLTKRIEQIERRLRHKVLAIAARFRDAQSGFLEKVAADWALQRGGSEETGMGMNSALAAQSEELTSIFIDANRLRVSALEEIMGVLDVYQGALYLETLARFLVGFRDSGLLHAFQRSKTPLSPLI